MRGTRRRWGALLPEVRIHTAPGLFLPRVYRSLTARAFSVIGRGGRRSSGGDTAIPSYRILSSGLAPGGVRARRVRGARSPARLSRTDSGASRGEVLHSVPNDHQSSRGLLPRMPATPAVRRAGRKGRRTGAMVRIARERVSDLFALAERESLGRQPELADRYVALARRIGMRYNVRLLREYRELYCRACSTFWVEGRTVRTRLRNGRRVRTCLKCGRRRRTLVRIPTLSSHPPPGGPREAPRDEGTLSGPVTEDADLTEEETEDE